MAANQKFNYSSTNPEEPDFFHVIVDNNISTILALLLSTIGWAISLPLIYSIIWYVRSGFEKYNLFANELLTSMCWICIEWFILLHTTYFCRFTLGPLPKKICFWQHLISRVIVKQAILILDTMVITRYASIFWLKNPAAFQSDFWIIFVNLWVTCFAFFFHFTVEMLVTNETLEYHFCIGKDPSKAFMLPKYFLGHLEIVSITMIVIIQLKIYLFKNKKTILPETYSTHSRKLQITCIEKSTIGNVVSDFLLVLVISPNVVCSMIINQTPWQELARYPNYIYFYVKFLLGPWLASILVPFLYISKHEKLRRNLSRWIKRE